MYKDRESETAHGWRNALLSDSMTAWKELVPAQVIKPYVAFNLQQQKTFVDVSSLWMNYLMTLAKKHREVQANGDNLEKAFDGVFDASKDLFESFVSLMDRHLETISELSPPVCRKSNLP